MAWHGPTLNTRWSRIWKPRGWKNVVFSPAKRILRFVNKSPTAVDTAAQVWGVRIRKHGNWQEDITMPRLPGLWSVTKLTELDSQEVGAKSGLLTIEPKALC